MDTSSSSTGPSFFDAYAFRIEIALVLSLVLVLALVNLPGGTTEDRVGWSTRSEMRPFEQIMVTEVQSEASEESNTETTSAEPVEGAPPPTDVDSRPREEAVAVVEKKDGEPESPEHSEASEDPYSEVRSVSSLALEDTQPQIVGGLGSLYLNIDYPEEARRKGIQGRLKLEFTVESDGDVTNVDVVDSLHPLCDSAAVEGVRSVDFVPAQRNGERIPVRMLLPVRFRIISMQGTPQTADLEQ